MTNQICSITSASRPLVAFQQNVFWIYLTKLKQYSVLFDFLVLDICPELWPIVLFFIKLSKSGDLPRCFQQQNWHLKEAAIFGAAVNLNRCFCWIRVVSPPNQFPPLVDSPLVVFPLVVSPPPDVLPPKRFAPKMFRPQTSILEFHSILSYYNFSSVYFIYYWQHLRVTEFRLWKTTSNIGLLNAVGSAAKCCVTT